MITKELAETATEINVIFDNLSQDILNKIPMKIQNFFKNIASESYHFEYDITKPLSEQQLKPKTKGIIALLYRDYICNEESRIEYVKKYNSYIERQEEIKHEKYNIDNLFKTSEKQEINDEVLPVICIKEKWYTKILKLFKNFILKKR